MTKGQDSREGHTCLCRVDCYQRWWLWLHRHLKLNVVGIPDGDKATSVLAMKSG